MTEQDPTHLKFYGDMSPQRAKEFVAIALDYGLTLDESRSSVRHELTDALLSFYFREVRHLPAEQIDSWLIYTEAENHPVKSLLSEMTYLGGTTIASLQERSYESFIAAHKELMHGWYSATLLLEFMIRHKLRFSDADPAELMQTRIISLDMPARLRSRLIVTCGLNWLEQLGHISELDMFDLRGVGDDTLEGVKRLMGDKIQFLPD